MLRKRRKVRACGKGKNEGKGRSLSIIKSTKPNFFVFIKDIQSGIEKGMTDKKLLTEGMNRETMKKAFSKDMKNEEENIRIIRDNDIRQDSMGSETAAALNSEDTNRGIRNMTIGEIHKMTIIEGKRMAVMLRATMRTDF